MTTDYKEPKVSERYVVHFNLDNRLRTPGKCSSDSPMKPGDTFDHRDERAIVRSCSPVTVVAPRRPTNYGEGRR